jgi:hypothetical protein
MDQDMWNAVVVEWFIGFLFDRYERKCSNKEERHKKKESHPRCLANFTIFVASNSFAFSAMQRTKGRM